MQIGISRRDCQRPRLWIAGATAQMKRGSTGVPAEASVAVLLEGHPWRKRPAQVSRASGGMQEVCEGETRRIAIAKLMAGHDREAYRGRCLQQQRYPLVGFLLALGA